MIAEAYGGRYRVMNKEKLAKLLQTDPDRGMKKLIDEYGGLVTAVISGRMRADRFSFQDVEDCASETFFEFWRGFEKAPCRGSDIRARLCVIAKRNAIDRLRRLYRQPDTISMDAENSAELRSEHSLEGDLEEKEERLALINAVKALGPPDSEIIIRKYYLGQSSKDAAKELKMSVSNFDTRAHRAIKKLRTMLGGTDNEQEY